MQKHRKHTARAEAESEDTITIWVSPKRARAIEDLAKRRGVDLDTLFLEAMAFGLRHDNIDVPKGVADAMAVDLFKRGSRVLPPVPKLTKLDRN